MTRGINRFRAVTGAIANAVGRQRAAMRPLKPARILLLHELLLGDTLMLAPLMAALRTKYPEAELLVAARPAYASLLGNRPYEAKVLPFSERDSAGLSSLAPAAGCDLAILPGENRYAIAARAIGAKWIVGFAGGRPAWRDRAVDELIPFPSTPTALADILAQLAGLDSLQAAQLRYRTGDWPSPEFTPFELPPGPYVVLHVGAGSPLRLWMPQNWFRLAKAISATGLRVVWSAGQGEEGLVRQIDPHQEFASFAGMLDLPQLWQLLEKARFAVTLDTGIAHLAKLTRTPVAALFGPGSGVLFGKGSFWQDNDFREVSDLGIPCRDQQHLFKREVSWVRRCNRSMAECPRARCMEALSVEQVLAAVQVE